MNEQFDTLDAALHQWGRYDDSPFKWDKAHDAFALGQAFFDKHDYGQPLCYYTIETGQYVGVKWRIFGTGMNFQAGFIYCAFKLADDWVPRQLGGYKYAFPDHRDSTRERDEHIGEMLCSHCWLWGPQGEDCAHCGKPQ